jgi:hypothetical protein
MQRYGQPDPNCVYGLEQDDNGQWVRYEDALAALAAVAPSPAPAGGAEPVVEPIGFVYPHQLLKLRNSRKGVEMLTVSVKETEYVNQPLYAAPTAQPQPQPEAQTDCLGPAKCERSMCMQTNRCQIETPARPVVLFDDRPQNQRIAEAEERMRNPAPLQFEDEPAQPKPWEPSAIAQLQHLVDDIVVTVREEDGVDIHKVADGMSLTFSNMIGAVTRLLAAQPEAPAEPTAYLHQCRKKPELRRVDFSRRPSNIERNSGWFSSPLYATPAPAAQQPAELTDERISDIIYEIHCVTATKADIECARLLILKAQGGSR